MLTQDRATELAKRRYNRIAPLYDLMESLVERSRYSKWRKLLWSKVEGTKILEIGIGTGKNFPYYPSDVEITAIDFSEKLIMHANATFISGLRSDEGNPYAGSTLSFSGTETNNTGEGQFYMENDSYLELYDSFLLHKQGANNSTQWQLYWYGDVIAKRSSLESWWTIRFFGDNNSLEDIDSIKTFQNNLSTPSFPHKLIPIIFWFPAISRKYICC